jgi:tetratricopeptide (TPR) repeat protein
VLELLGEARAAVERRPHASPELRVEVLGIVGSSLLNHQETDAAEAVLTQAVNEALRDLGAEHPETLRARVRLVAVSRFRGRTRELRQELDRLLPALRNGSPALAEDLVVALKNKAHLEMDEGRFDEGLAAAEEAMEVAGRTLGPRHPETVAAALMLALASLNRGDVEAALARAESAYRLTLEVYPDEATHARRIEAENLYGRVLAAAGQVARGAAHVEAAIERASEVFGPSSRMVGVFSRQLARFQVGLGQVGRALETSERALAISGEHSDRDSYRHADALLARGEVLLAALRTHEAADVLGQAAAILASALGPTHERTVGARCSLALAWAREGRTAKARAEVADLLQGDATGRVRYALGVVERLDGRPEEALRLQREWLASLPSGGAAEWDRMQALVEVGLAQVALGRHGEGAESLSDALRLSRRLQAGPTPERALTLAGLGRALIARGRAEDARRALREAQAFWRAFAPDSPWAAEAALLAARAERDAGADVARAERASRALSRRP